MIREICNVELFELCETIPKVQCSECLLYWNQGIVYCTCGHPLKESESSHNFHKWRPDAFSIPYYVINKGRPRGARHRKTEAQKQHFVAHNARKRCIKKNYDGIHDRFQRDPAYRDSQLKIGWTEEKCITMDKLAQEDHSYRLSRDEFQRYQKQWYLTLNKSIHRCDFDQTSEPQSQSRTVSTENEEKNVQNLFLFNNIKDGTLLPQVIPGGTGTRPKSWWSS